MPRHGLIRLNSLDGPRERTFDLPDNWDHMTDDERKAIWHPVKERLMNDAVDFSVTVEGEDV